MSRRIEVLGAARCPHHDATVVAAREVAARLAPDAIIEARRVGSEDEARELRMPGSHTVRVDGLDLEPGLEHLPSLDCRLYDGDPVPPGWLLEAGLLRAMQPRHILFLCVANSARSQLAEGIARRLAPQGVRISSAGSAPTRVRPQAIRVLDEVGIDIRGHASKSVQQVDAASVDAVITLCAEEVCPVFLGRAHRLHWGLEDPAAVEGSEAQQLEAFRRTRDELRRRLATLFNGWRAEARRPE